MRNLVEMKVPIAVLLLALSSAHVSADTDVNPLSKVLQMLADLQAKLFKEGEASQKEYNEFSEWCEDRSQELHFAIKTGKGEVRSLNAAIDKANADAQALQSKIDETAGDIADDESELKEANGIRGTENKQFQEEEQELLKTVDTLERAISIVQKEMQGGAFLQTDDQQNAQSVLKALKAIVEASSISSSDAARLTALVQSSSSSSSDDSDSDDSDEVGAPSASQYENQSGGVLETLQGLLEQAQTQLDSARKEESNAAHNHNMKKQSLEDALKVSNRELDEAKSNLAAVNEAKATDEGDLQSTSKDLQEDIKELEELHHTCLGKATDFEGEMKSRNEELQALQEAKKIIQQTTGAATEQTYGLVQAPSFLQVAAKQELSGSARALKIIRRMAYQGRSSILMQLASRMQSALRLGNADGADPFEKVKGLIVDMIATLEQEAEAEATEKAYCDKEMTETKAKQDDKTDEANKHSTKIDQMVGGSQKLKSEIATLNQELADLAKSQAEMDRIRQEEHSQYSKSRPEMEQGLEGVKTALKVLKDYYAQPAFVQMEANTKGPSAIIGLLEVAESDFTKLLTEIIAEEEQAQALYEETTKENEVAKATKQGDVKGKTKEAAALDKGSAELKSDLSGVEDELSAINEYDKKIKGRCIKKAESYEDRTARREAEIAGLKDALAALGGEAVLLQDDVSPDTEAPRRTLRGIRRS